MLDLAPLYGFTLVLKSDPSTYYSNLGMMFSYLV